MLQSQPRFLTLEGGEGAGKSTVLSALRDALLADRQDVVCTAMASGGYDLPDLKGGGRLATNIFGDPGKGYLVPMLRMDDIEKTGALTATSGCLGQSPPWYPCSLSVRPSMMPVESSTMGTPVALLRNGTVRDARGLTSST